MSDKKISQLPASTTPLAGTEELAIVQSGDTKKVTVANLTAGRSVAAGDLSYTGTLTGSTGVLNIGSGQVYKDASGNVGFGTSSPTPGVNTNYSGIHLNGSVGTAIKLTNQTTGSSATDGFDLILQAAGSDAYIWQRENANIIFGTNGEERARVTANGIAMASGKGIDFSADGQAAGMTSELLDDYEEGTWTPTVSSFNGTLTSYTAIGRYTKIGRMVFIYCSVQITDVGTGSGNLTIAGYPFTSVNAGYDQAAISLWREVNATGGTGPVGLPINGTSSALLTGATGIATGYAFVYNLVYEAA